LRFVRVKPDVTKGTSLAQEVPTLIQFHLDLHEPFTIGFGVRPLPVQSVFLCDKALNMIEDGLIFGLILHKSLLRHRCDRKVRIFYAHPKLRSTDALDDEKGNSTGDPALGGRSPVCGA
jgi:hypothetical protein